MTTARRALFWICILSGCKTATHSAEAEVTAGALDAGSGGRARATAIAVDASPAPDDTVLPAANPELVTRARHLLEAIAQDDATLAGDILFPRDGWLATRDVEDPGKDWDRHVATPFRRQMHTLSRRHRDLSRAQVVSLELGGAVTQTSMRHRGWRKGLWTVSDSRLTFVADGHTQVLSIREMVAWRGAWYVTRLR